MYTISLDSANCLLSFEEGGVKTSTFTVHEVKVIVDGLLDRRARNNGVGRHLLSLLRMKGMFQHHFSGNSGDLGFMAYKTPSNQYAVSLFGDYRHGLVNQLNRPGECSLAIAQMRSMRAERRRLRALGLYRDPVRPNTPRALVGANVNLKRHFRNSTLTYLDAVLVIAHAARLNRDWVQKRLLRSLDVRAIASLRLKGGFVFRVDLSHKFRGLLDLSAPVELRTTNDNRHLAYRRLRNSLRKRLKRERRARVVAQQNYEALRLMRRKVNRVLI